ncbi:LemA family protein [Bacteroidales bacterium OttesenSCG-928-M06]|nr:LemA family protein [Bacteroidales bacterium OttesenSCG-928-M06]
MKKSLIVILILVVVAAGIFFWFKGTYNNLVQADEKVKAQWGNVENQYQRRSDLVPNLVATVKGYAQHEQTTLENVINARAKATQVTIDPTNLNEQTMAQFQQVQGELGSAINRLLVSVEAYPDLKANENFRDLQAQLEGTENRIATERTRFNDQAQIYNNTVRSFPANIVAGMFGFIQKPYFKSQPGAEVAPQVQF